MSEGGESFTKGVFLNSFGSIPPHEINRIVAIANAYGSLMSSAVQSACHADEARTNLVVTAQKLELPADDIRILEAYAKELSLTTSLSFVDAIGLVRARLLNNDVADILVRYTIIR